MSLRPNKFLVILLLIVVAFIVGYFNEEISIFFFDRRAMIGLLSSTLIVLLGVIANRVQKIQYLLRSNEELRRDNEFVRKQLYGKQSIGDKLNDNQLTLLQKFAETQLLISERFPRKTK